MTRQPPPRQIQQMAEEIFELMKLSWMGSKATADKDEYDLSESEVLALDLLTKNESMTVGELQRNIGVLPAQMSRVIRSLEGKADKPLVTCALNPADKRKIDVTISQTGRQALQGYQSAKLASTIGVLAELDETDRDEFMRVLRIIREKLVKATMRDL